MPKYRYTFCDGTVNDVEVSDEEYALLKEFDERERLNNLRRGQSVPHNGLSEKETDGKSEG